MSALLRSVVASPVACEQIHGRDIILSTATCRAKKNGYTGWNIDWEPSDPKKVKPGDAEAYAAFLDTFAKAMHQHDLTVTVDVASWSPIWNLTLLAQTDVDLLETMSTYTDNPDTWDKQLDAALAAIPLSKLRVGLETMRNDGTPYDPKELARRFARLADANVRSIGLWKSPVPDEWWSFLNKFAAA